MGQLQLPLDDVAWVTSYCASLLLLIWGAVGNWSGYATIAARVVIVTMFCYFIFMLLPISKPINVLLKAISVFVFPEGYGNRMYGSEIARPPATSVPFAAPPSAPSIAGV